MGPEIRVTDPAAKDTFAQLRKELFQITATQDALAADHATLSTTVADLSTNQTATSRQVSALKSATAPTTVVNPSIPQPTPGEGHTPPGAVDTTQALAVVNATAAEYPNLVAVFSTDDAAVAAAQELLLRILWHLQIAGFNAGRQRNPSGLLSNDKITIFLGAAWHAYDIFTLGYAGHATTVHLFEVSAPNSVPDPGIAD